MKIEYTQGVVEYDKIIELINVEYSDKNLQDIRLVEMNKKLIAQANIHLDDEFHSTKLCYIEYEDIEEIIVRYIRSKGIEVLKHNDEEYCIWLERYESRDHVEYSIRFRY